MGVRSKRICGEEVENKAEGDKEEGWEGGE